MVRDAFDGAPYGILVMRPNGTIAGINGRARGLLAPRPGGGDLLGAACCDVLGCKTAEGAQGACLTKSALHRIGPLTEVRLPTPDRDGASLYASAARARAGVVIYLRLATEHRPAPGRPRLRVLTLGSTRLEAPGGILDGDWLSQRPGELFKLFVVRRTRILHVEEIAETLWPDSDRNGLGNVRHFVHALRECLEPERAKHSRGSFLATRSGGYMLDLSLVSIDADDFESLVDRGARAAASGHDDEAVDLLERAMALYRGDFLADEPYADWAVAERDRLRTLAGRALDRLATAHLTSHRPDEALVALQRLAELEPYDLDVHRSLMTLCLQIGRRSQAMRCHDALNRRMRRTFGEALDFTLTDLPVAGPLQRRARADP